MSSACALLLLSTTISCSANIDAYGPIRLAATDPALLDETKLFVFSFSTTTPCADLINLNPGEIGERLVDERAPLQPLEPGGPVEHVFGNVPPNTSIAYFVLASALTRGELDQRIEFSDLNGSVFGMACRDFAAPSGTRHDLPMSLFPVGLR